MSVALMLLDSRITPSKSSTMALMGGAGAASPMQATGSWVGCLSMPGAALTGNAADDGVAHVVGGKGRFTGMGDVRSAAAGL